MTSTSAVTEDPVSPAEDDHSPPPVAAVSTATRRQARRRRRRARTGAARVDRVDRALLATLGLVAIAVGTLALLAAQGDRVDLREPRSLYLEAKDSVLAHSELWTAGAIAGGVVVALLGLLWAWSQVRPHPERGRLGETVLTGERRGRTSLAPAPVARALAADVRTVDGVVDASARVVALGQVPEVLLSIETLIGADLPAVRAALEAPLARLGASLGVQAVDLELRIKIGSDEASRVT
ncbi:hypothetical protein BH24ACT4_BH24ACT4_08480 [soil metagenome]